MENQQQQPQTTSQCRGGCGFYGSPATEGLCSKCFKDSIKRKQDTGSNRLVSPNSSGVSSSSVGSADASTSANVSTASVVAAAIANFNESSVINSALGNATGSGNNQDAIAPNANVPSPMDGVETSACGPAITLAQHISAHMDGLDSPASLASSCSANSLEESIVHGAAIGSGDSTPNTPPAVKKANRCHMCKKRVGLTGFMCRCGGLYCGEHRYDKAHNCTFDYKTMEREEIRKNNPVVVSDKIARI